MSQIYWFQRVDAATKCPCLFLDRDGVIVEEVHYLHRREDVRLLPGAAALIEAARGQGWAVGLVTNQAGIGRGYYGWAEFDAVQHEIIHQLGAGAEPFDFVAACAVHAEAAHAFYKAVDHPWRKPRPGMLDMAVASLDIDRAASVMIGDQLSDLQAGAAAHIAHLIHVETGHGAGQTAKAAAFAASHPGQVSLVSGLDAARVLLGW